MSRPLCTQPPAVAVLRSALPDGQAGAAAPTSLRLIPAGPFRAPDGRPADAPAWQLDGETAARLVADMAARQSARYIDYEHATLHAKLQSTRAPRGVRDGGGGRGELGNSIVDTARAERARGPGRQREWMWGLAALQRWRRAGARQTQTGSVARYPEVQGRAGVPRARGQEPAVGISDNDEPRKECCSAKGSGAKIARLEPDQG